MKTALRYPVTFYIFLLLAGMAGAGLVTASISLMGPGLTHDSAAYIFAARSLLEGRGFEYFGYPSPFIQWPPLYPILLAAAGLLGVGHLAAAGAINAAAHALIIIITGYWLYSRLKSRLCAVLGIVLLVFSLPLLQVSKYLWTETLFILFYILFYICFEKFIYTRHYKYLVTAGVFAAIACIDRYAGVTIVLAASAFLIFQKKGLLFKFRDIFIFGLISCLPFAVWVARNYLVSATLLGVRLPSTYGLMLNIRRSVTSLYSWIAPDPMLGGIIPAAVIPVLIAFTIMLPLVIITVFAIMLLYRLIEKAAAFKKPEPRNSIAEKTELYEKNYPVFFMGAFSAIYMVYLLASATKVLFEPINSRYLVPVYIPLFIIFIFGLDFLTVKFVHSLKPILKACAAILLGIFILYPVINTVASVAGYAANGAGGYASKVLYENKLVAYVRENPEDCTYYSNSADMVSVLSGVRTYYLPKRQGPYMYSLEQFKNAVENDECSRLVWFNSGVSTTVYGVEDIAKLYRLEVIQQYEKGTVYRILKQEAPVDE